MIIGVDAGGLGVPDDRLKVGNYQFTLNLLKNLTRLDKKNRYLLYSFSPLEDKVLKQFGTNTDNLVLKPKVGWLSFRLSWEFFLNKPDLFIGLNQALPIFHPLKSIVFVLDLAFEHYPGCYQQFYSRLSRQTRFAVKYGDKIVAISKATKNDLIKIYNIDREKIEIIPLGVDPMMAPQPQDVIDGIRTKYHLTDPFFLFVGSFKPIKNIPRIIESFALFLTQVKMRYKLVLVGSDFWLDKEIQKTVKKLGLNKHIIILGFLPREDLPGIYSGAKALISPSLYEGFGMPLLEAMACGLPVITANVGSMPEVVVKAGLLVDPFNTYDISRVLRRIVAETDLVDELKKKGLERVKQFSWKEAAVELLKIINNL